MPHLVYHLRHLTMAMPGFDKVAMITSLSVPVIAGFIILFDQAQLPDAVVDVRDPGVWSDVAPEPARN